GAACLRGKLVANGGVLPDLVTLADPVRRKCSAPERAQTLHWWLPEANRSSPLPDGKTRLALRRVKRWPGHGMDRVSGLSHRRDRQRAGSLRQVRLAADSAVRHRGERAARVPVLRRAWLHLVQREGQRAGEEGSLEEGSAGLRQADRRHD